jgi:LAS superfamily LD-carboxypeptidase LdcB
MAPLAVPGTSNHNLGIAVDIANASGKRLEWMLANAHKYGFSWELQSEPWHIRYVAGDDIPEAVKIWKESKVDEA